MKCRLFLASLFIFIGALLSPKAYAYELTTEVQATGNSWKISSVRCVNGDASTKVVSVKNTPTCFAYNNQQEEQSLYAITSAQKIPVVAGNYYRFSISLQSPTFQVNSLMWYPATTPNFVLISANQVSVTQTDSQATTIVGTTSYSYIYDVTLRATVDDEVFVAFGNGSNTLLFIPNTAIPYRAFLSMGDVYEYKASDTATSINDQQKQEGEKAQQEGQTSTDNAQSSIDNSTVSLLSALTGFVGVLTSINPSSCSLSGNIGTGGLNLGQLDFCKDKPPAFVTAIGSLVAIVLIIPLIIWMVNKIISMFRSFTNG